MTAQALENTSLIMQPRYDLVKIKFATDAPTFDKAIELRGDFKRDTVWATRRQLLRKTQQFKLSEIN